METFYQDVTCPKCDSGDLRIEWMPAREEREVVVGGVESLRYAFTPIEQVPDEAKEVEPAEPECMFIECARCRYVWRMAPMSETASR